MYEARGARTTTTWLVGFPNCFGSLFIYLRLLQCACVVAVVVVHVNNCPFVYADFFLLFYMPFIYFYFYLVPLQTVLLRGQGISIIASCHTHAPKRSLMRQHCQMCRAYVFIFVLTALKRLLLHTYINIYT